MTACALTDHGSMAGLLKFQQACQEADIKSILGCEAYLTLDPDDTEDKTKDNYHAVILAKNIDGYRGLAKLSSEAHIHNFYYKPRININKLSELKDNVIITSACLAGFLPKMAIWDESSNTFLDPEDNIPRTLELVQSLVGRDNVFIEIQWWDNPEQYAWNDFAIELARDTKTPLVITTDAHYLKQEDHELHQMMMAMQFGKKLDDYLANSEMLYSNDLWVKPPEVMWEIAEKIGIPEAAQNTNLIAEQCNVVIETGTYYPPIFDITQEDDYKDFLNWKKKYKAHFGEK